MSRSYLLYKRRKQRELLITTCNVVFRGGLKILLTVSNQQNPACPNFIDNTDESMKYKPRIKLDKRGYSMKSRLILFH
jgi:hypothetical protein